MRIDKLRFRNLNSLKGEWIVDFTDPALTDAGIFLITGPTGSGKSTLLDAICLALFHRTPRQKKLSNTVDEVMTKHTSDAFAEVYFSTDRGRYRALWYHARTRANSKTPFAQPKCEFEELTDGDGPRKVETRGVIDLVEAACGMNYERFTRSMLLAQGEFARFLSSAGKDRSAILEDITGTGIYARISAAIYARFKEESDRVARLQDRLGQVRILSEAELAARQRRLDRYGAALDTLTAGRDGARSLLAWCGTGARLERDVVAAKEALAAAESRAQSLAPERDRLALDGRATPLDGPIRDAARTRKEREESLAALEAARALLPGLEAKEKETSGAFETAGCADAQAKDARAKAVPVLKDMRALDAGLERARASAAEAQKELARVRAGAQKEEQEIAAARATLTRYERGMADLDRRLADTARDADLPARLAGLEVSFENARILAGDLAQARKEAAGAEKEEKDARAALEAAVSDLNARTAASSAAGKKAVEAGRERDALLAGTSLASLRDLVADAAEAARGEEDAGDRVRDAGDAWKDCVTARDRLAGCLEERARLAVDGERIARALKDARSRVEELESARRMADLVRGLEEHRKALVDGEPCPCCGSTDHPWARGQVPLENEVEKRLAEATRRRDQLQGEHNRVAAALSASVSLENERREGCRTAASALGQKDARLRASLETVAAALDRLDAEWLSAPGNALFAEALSAGAPADVVSSEAGGANARAALASAAKQLRDLADAHARSVAEARTLLEDIAARTAPVADEAALSGGAAGAPVVPALAADKADALARDMADTLGRVRALLASLGGAAGLFARRAEEAEKKAADLERQANAERLARGAAEARAATAEERVKNAAKAAVGAKERADGASARESAARADLARALAPYGVAEEELAGNSFDALLKNLEARASARVKLEEDRDATAKALDRGRVALQGLESGLARVREEETQRLATARDLDAARVRLEEARRERFGDRVADAWEKELDDRVSAAGVALAAAEKAFRDAEMARKAHRTRLEGLEANAKKADAAWEAGRTALAAELARCGFATLEEAVAARLDPERAAELRARVEDAAKALAAAKGALDGAKDRAREHAAARPEDLDTVLSETRALAEAALTAARAAAQAPLPSDGDGSVGETAGAPDATDAGEGGTPPDADGMDAAKGTVGSEDADGTGEAEEDLRIGLDAPDPDAPATDAGAVELLTWRAERLDAFMMDVASRQGALESELRTDTEVRARHAELARQVEAARESLARWTELSNLAGSADGTRFRNFAQGLTFSRLVRVANRELARLNDRYVLAQSETDFLEFEVVDTYMANQRRTTRNLSGGETFIVSLALALALSSLSAGRTRIETLFLDEGFGTLDPDALDAAVTTLTGLRGNGTSLVGIISHVDALRERLDTQIHLERRMDGTSTLSGPGCSSVAVENTRRRRRAS